MTRSFSDILVQKDFKDMNYAQYGGVLGFLVMPQYRVKRSTLTAG